MTSGSVIALVKKSVAKYGVTVSWKEAIMELNSREELVTLPGSNTITEKILLLKEKYNPIRDGNMSVGMVPDLARYILALPDSRILPEIVVTDQHGDKWRLGPIDWFDIAGTAVCKQCPVERVA